MTRFPEERVAELLRTLTPAPPAWVEAAQELPRARRSLDELLERAAADATLRAALAADVEAELARAGLRPIRPLVDRVRQQLG